MVKTPELEAYSSVGSTNGCGNSSLSFMLAKLAQWLVGLDFKPACDIHDLEWGIPQKYKSVAHWRESNFNFLFNLMQLCGEPEQTVKYRMKLRVCTLFYTAVMLNTFEDYKSG